MSEEATFWRMEAERHLCTDYELCPDCGMCGGGCCSCGDDER